VIRFRKRITLARLAAVPLIVGVTFAVGSWGHAPWPTSALNAGLFVLPVFITGATLAQWLIFYIVAGVLVGLMAPLVTHRGPTTVTRAAASAPVVPRVKGSPPAQ
jgi:hypothetical protein